MRFDFYSNFTTRIDIISLVDSLFSSVFPLFLKGKQGTISSYKGCKSGFFWIKKHMKWQQSNRRNDKICKDTLIHFYVKTSEVHLAHIHVDFFLRPSDIWGNFTVRKNHYLLYIISQMHISRKVNIGAFFFLSNKYFRLSLKGKRSI